ncbi:hypothetical protein V5T82_16370 [Magnetovibrio sp. PR-2]|uniref:hypothetical protein n=1 Tax=Magnetovibrio sp. PR-2 TaxID=3120356 RepID=UPI002FCE0496
MAITPTMTAQAATMKPVAAGGAFAGKSLGLGLGIGAWGPIALGVIGAAAVYSYMRSRKAEVDQSEEEQELAEAIADA